MLLDQALPARCHAIAVSPDGTRCVAVARRPGTFAAVVDLPSRRIVQQLTATQGRTFAGHAVFSQDGSRLLLTEDDTQREEGFVAIRAVAEAYRPAGCFRTHGVGPHELLHIFVMAGTVTHFGFMVRYVVPFDRATRVEPEP